jgi:hypothetical protein
MSATNTNIDLKGIERRAWLSTFQDGLWDLCLGAILLVMGSDTVIARAIEAHGWGYAQWSIAITLALETVVFGTFWAAKRFITVPRMGLVKFGSKGKTRGIRVAIVLGASALVGLAVFAALTLAQSDSPQQALMDIIGPVAYALNMLLVFGLWGYFWSFERLYLIGLMYALPVPLRIALYELAGIHIGYAAFAVPGAVILAMGTVVFIRFLRDYPLGKEEPNVSD